MWTCRSCDLVQAEAKICLRCGAENAGEGAQETEIDLDDTRAGRMLDFGSGPQSDGVELAYSPEARRPGQRQNPTYTPSSLPGRPIARRPQNAAPAKRSSAGYLVPLVIIGALVIGGAWGRAWWQAHSKARALSAQIAGFSEALDGLEAPPDGDAVVAIVLEAARRADVRMRRDQVRPSIEVIEVQNLGGGDNPEADSPLERCKAGRLPPSWERVPIPERQAFEVAVQRCVAPRFVVGFDLRVEIGNALHTRRVKLSRYTLRRQVAPGALTN